MAGRKAQIDQLVEIHNQEERNRLQAETDQRTQRRAVRLSNLQDRLAIVFDATDVIELQITSSLTDIDEPFFRLVYENRVYQVTRRISETENESGFLVEVEGRFSGASTLGEVAQSIARTHIQLEFLAGR